MCGAMSAYDPCALPSWLPNVPAAVNSWMQGETWVRLVEWAAMSASLASQVAAGPGGPVHSLSHTITVRGDGAGAAAGASSRLPSAAGSIAIMSDVGQAALGPCCLRWLRFAPICRFV